MSGNRNTMTHRRGEWYPSAMLEAFLILFVTQWADVVNLLSSKGMKEISYMMLPAAMIYGVISFTAALKHRWIDKSPELT